LPGPQPIITAWPYTIPLDNVPAELAQKLADKTIIRENGCHEWVGTRIATGYGKVSWEGRHYLTHRVAWVLANGPIPAGLDCMHRCDNPPCVNAAHLDVGTRQDNMQDMMAKGRGVVGERKNQAVLNNKKASEIKKLILGRKLTLAEIGRMFGVSGGAIRGIKIGRNWRHVPWTMEED